MINYDMYGLQGVQRLKDATPVDTGETRNGWHYKVVNEKVFFYNDNPEVIRYLCQGHMSTAGTWVAGNDFVSPILKEIQNDIRRETHKNGRRVLRRERRRLRNNAKFSK